MDGQIIEGMERPRSGDRRLDPEYAGAEAGVQLTAYPLPRGAGRATGDRPPPGALAPSRGDRPSARRVRGGVSQGQRSGLGPVRRRVPGDPRGLPRRRGIRVGPGGADRDRGRHPRPARRPGRARGRLRRRPVLAVDPQPGWPGLRPRPLAPPAPALPAHRRRLRHRGAERAGHRDRAPVRRPRASTSSSARSAPSSSWPTSSRPSRRRRGCCAPAAGSRSRSRHPTRWMFPDDPTEEGLTASQSVLGPDAVRRGRGLHRRHRVRRAPPHPGRLGRPALRCRLPADDPAGAGVAGRPRPAVGRVVRGPRHG